MSSCSATTTTTTSTAAVDQPLVNWVKVFLFSPRSRRTLVATIGKNLLQLCWFGQPGIDWLVLKFYVGDFLEKHQRVQNWPEVTICDSLLVHDENYGLGLYMWGLPQGQLVNGPMVIGSVLSMVLGSRIGSVMVLVMVSFMGSVNLSHHSDQMSQGSEVSKLTFCFKIQKWPQSTPLTTTMVGGWVHS